MGFLTNLGLAAGRSILIGQDMQAKQADIDLKKQQVAMGQIAVENAQRQQQTQQTVGSFLSSEIARDNAAASDPVKSAQMYQRAEGIALQGGDFTTANELGTLAKGKLQEAKEAIATVTAQKHQKNEDLANAADEFAANPTADGYRDLARKAAEAGQDPSRIPMPNTPQFATWLNQQKMAGMDSKARAEFTQKAYEADQNRQARIEAHNDNVALRQQSMQQTAMMREAMQSDRQARLQMERERLNLEEKKYATQGTRQTSQQVAANNAIIGSAAESVRGLHVIGALDSDQTAGPFQGLAGGTILDVLAKTGGNVLTTQDQQLYHTATAGLGLELARTMTLGGGRGANQATINELQDVVTAHPGDTKATAVFKFANAADIIRNRLESMPTPQDPEQAGKRQKLLEELKKVPTPNQVIATVKDPKQRAKMLSSQESMSDAVGKVDTAPAVGLPGSPDTGAGTNAPPLPAGGVPSDIQSLVNKYRSK